ncbi:hypothetical protein, partial [Bradyrhizobium sp. Leo170]|uniref:hypothetical protein n=1 Tax=Bradyrhizobium sp. Leo170 TaxID=1571199 RepID=UPI001A90E7CD
MIPSRWPAFARFGATDFETSTKAGKICQSLQRVPKQDGSQKFPFNFKDDQVLRQLHAAWMQHGQRLE